MEWVQTTAKTVEEATELALDQLGVAEDDAEVEVLEEPRPGLFGRVRGEARVRARVRPSRPRPKVERRERRRRPGSGEAAAGEAAATSAPDGDVDLGAPAPAEDVEPSPAEGVDPERHPARSRRRREPTSAPRASRSPSGVVAEGRVARAESNGEPSSDRDAGEDEADGAAVGPAAAAFLEGLADAIGVDAEASLGGAADELEVRLEGPDLGLLIGPRGQTLLAVQDLTRTVSQRGITNHGRLHVDVGGYRERRRVALARFTTSIAEEVVGSGEARMLEPMGAADRKVVHDTAATVAGVETRSEGEEPNRRVVISPSATA